MKNIFDITDIDITDVTTNTYDLYIFASGYEKRSRYLLGKVRSNLTDNTHSKICLTFEDHKNIFDRVSNDQHFKKNNFTFINGDSNCYGDLSKIIRTALSNLKKSETINILIDYTVMRRDWYAEILQALNQLSKEGYVVSATFSYSCGNYIGDKSPKAVKGYSLIPGFDGVGSQTKDKYGIYSLGFDGITTLSLHDWIEPTHVTCIIANPGVRPGSAKKCRKLNEDFIDIYAPDVTETPVHSVRRYCMVLNEIVKLNREKYDIIVHGGGPKPFVLGDFLSALRGDDIALIYLKGREAEPINVEPTGETVCTRIDFFPSINS